MLDMLNEGPADRRTYSPDTRHDPCHIEPGGGSNACCDSESPAYTCVTCDGSKGVVELPSCGAPRRTPRQCLSIQAGVFFRGLTDKYIGRNIDVVTIAGSVTQHNTSVDIKNVMDTSTIPTPQQPVSPDPKSSRPRASEEDTRS